MAVDLSKQLRELQKSADDLNELTDKANEVVRRVEIFLGEKCRVGGYAGVNILSDEVPSDEGPDCESYLVYDRYKGDYRILVANCVNGDEVEKKPWAECSREVKLTALDFLPELISSLHAQVKEQIGAAQAKIERLDKMFPSASELQLRPSPAKKG
jgi:hypothetical protein